MNLKVSIGKKKSMYHRHILLGSDTTPTHRYRCGLRISPDWALNHVRILHKQAWDVKAPQRVRILNSAKLCLNYGRAVLAPLSMTIIAMLPPLHKKDQGTYVHDAQL